MDRHKY